MTGTHSKTDAFESARERETFRYDSTLIAATVKNDPPNLIPPSKLRSCADSALTSFAQLGLLRVGGSRSLISLFDSKFQYVVAEATPTLSLAPNATTLEGDDAQKLWLCGTALPRAGLCENVLVSPGLGAHRTSPNDDLPVSVVADLAADPACWDIPLHSDWPRPRFYAGVPIRSRRGINIGVFCVFGDVAQELGQSSQQVMRSLSRTITDHLDSRRTGESHRKSVRMLRGMGSFVEGKATMSGWRHGSEADFIDSPSMEGEGGLNKNQQRLQDEEEAKAATQAAAGDVSPTTSPVANPMEPPTPAQRRSHGQTSVPSGSNTSLLGASSASTLPKTNEDAREDEIGHVFSKASNIIRESLELEGSIFLDASIGSFAGLATKCSSEASSSGPMSSSSSSSDEKGSHGSHDRRPSTKLGEADVPCRVLGHSNSLSSSIDQISGSRGHTSFSERFLTKLLRRYPEGKIFVFDANGSLQSSDFSDEDTPQAMSPMGPDQQIFVPPQTELGRRRRKQMMSRENEGKVIMSLFSGARCVALVPIWDGQKQRWFAGGFVYTKTRTRILTVEGELSYLRAFGTVIMAEVARVNARIVDRAKTDLLSSISHELRSPLHGIILGSELLHDTTLDAFQGDVLHSLETCGRTLLDTIDNLLDYSKIANFLRPEAGRRSSSANVADRGLRGDDKELTIEAGMISLVSNVDVDVLTEEVVESLCAGVSFQKLAISNLAGERPSEHADTNALRRLDGMQALENMTSDNTGSGDAQSKMGDVAVTFDISPATSWTYRTEPGAIRRIIMNALGNSLKYTSKGFVNITVVQAQPSEGQRPNTHEIRIVVADSGRGMSEDYLRHHLFAPFYQEDTLSSGTGLGLSLVKELVLRLGGSIQVQSKLGHGTRVTIKLPLQPAMPTPSQTSIQKVLNLDHFRAQVAELKGLRARLIGFPSEYGVMPDEELSGQILSEGALITNICREWLAIQVIDEAAQETLVPDLILSTQGHLDQLLFERRQGVVSTPVVVVCRNTLTARQLATSPRFTGKKVIFEFISQPIGPRKLARILLLSFRRWTKLQASVIQTPTAPSMASADSDHAFKPSLRDSLATPMMSTDADVDRTEYFRRPEESPTAQQAQQFTENENTSTATLPERPLETSTPTPADPRPDPGELQAAPDTVPDRFLLVDDNSINLKILESYMKKLGHDYTTATDGKQALEAFRSGHGRYRCIFMDISMPVMDGFEATRRIRVFESQKNLARCQVFALTGLASASAQEEAFASGIDLFLTKPVKLKELSKILETRGLA